MFLEIMLTYVTIHTNVRSQISAFLTFTASSPFWLLFLDTGHYHYPPQKKNPKCPLFVLQPGQDFHFSNWTSYLVITCSLIIDPPPSSHSPCRYPQSFLRISCWTLASFYPAFCSSTPEILSSKGKFKWPQN